MPNLGFFAPFAPKGKKGREIIVSAAVKTVNKLRLILCFQLLPVGMPLAPGGPSLQAASPLPPVGDLLLSAQDAR